MTTIQLKDANGVSHRFAVSGSGTLDDPYVPASELTTGGAPLSSGNPVPVAIVDAGIPPSERQAAPFGYTAEEITDVVEPREQIPVAMFPALPGQQPASLSMPVALANEQINDFQGPLVSKMAPPVGTVLAFQDCLQYRQVALQITTGPGITAGVLTFEGSNGLDSAASGWAPLPLYDQATLAAAPVTSLTLAASVNRYYVGAVNFRYFRLRVTTAVAGGHVSVLPLFRMAPFALPGVYALSATSYLVTQGTVGAGSGASGNPNQLAGIDYGTIVRRLVSDAQGHLVVTGADPTRSGAAQPLKVTDDPGNLGRFNLSELLEMVVMELKLANFYLKELPLMLNLPGASFKEDINDFIGNPDKTANQ